MASDGPRTHSREGECPPFPCLAHTLSNRVVRSLLCASARIDGEEKLINKENRIEEGTEVGEEVG